MYMYICYRDEEGRKKLASSNKEYTLISAHLIDEIYRLQSYIRIELRPGTLRGRGERQRDRCPYLSGGLYHVELLEYRVHVACGSRVPETHVATWSSPHHRRLELHVYMYNM